MTTSEYHKAQISRLLDSEIVAISFNGKVYARKQLAEGLAMFISDQTRGLVAAPVLKGPNQLAFRHTAYSQWVITYR